MIITLFKRFWRQEGNQRSKNFDQQVFLSFGVKGVTILLNFYVVSMAYSYLDKEKYGIWATVISMANMLVFMDVGIGSGLRNQLSEALAKEQKNRAKELVSTAYVVLSLISLALVFFFCLIIPFFDWPTIFNTNKVDNQELIICVCLISSTISFNFISGLVNPVFQAFQKNSLAGLLAIINYIIFITLVFFIRNIVSNNLTYLSIIYLSSSIVAGVIIGIVTYKKFSFLKPSISFYNKDTLKSLTAVGFQLFLIQLAPIALIASDNLIITRYIGPIEVTDFSMAQRIYLGIWTTLWIFLSPLWSAVTEAYVKNDLVWIRKRVVKTLTTILPLSAIVLGIVALFFNQITRIWLNKEIYVPTSILLLFSAFVILNVWNYTFQYFLQGINRLKEILFISLFTTLIKIPLSILLIEEFGLGVSGVILATVISMIPLSIIGPFLTYSILSKRNL